jgi:hypothetical protein
MKDLTFHRRNILAYYQEHPFDEFTPQEIQQLLLPEVPLKDIRRAMCRMVEDDKLAVTANKKQAATGRLHKTYRIVSRYEHIWRMYSK